MMFGFVMWILMSSVREWFLDDLIAGNAWFLLVKWGWWECSVLNNLYGFFEDFDQVRLKPYFIRAERYFGVIYGDFWCDWDGEKHWFFKVLSNSVSNSKWGSRNRNIRYAVPGFRLSVLKCKPRPHHGMKIYYNSTVLWYVFDCQVIMLYTCFRPVVWSVK